MEKITDWFKLWAELSALQDAAFIRQQATRNSKKDPGPGQKKPKDFWEGRAKEFDKMVNRRWAGPDTSRKFLITTLKENPGSTLLDIGAGTGKWALLAAPYAAGVTAIEPSKAMLALLREKVASASNITIRKTRWPDPDIPPHDWVLASHSMYGASDFKAFIHHMNQTAKKGCILVLRLPFTDGVMARAARHVLGQPYDSPNFQVGYNCLMEMGIYPHVIMEDPGNWPTWRHDSLDQALAETKNRLGIPGPSGHDAFLYDLLKNHLPKKAGQWIWPRGNQSALVHWRVDGTTNNQREKYHE